LASYRQRPDEQPLQQLVVEEEEEEEYVSTTIDPRTSDLIVLQGREEVLMGLDTMDTMIFAMSNKKMALDTYNTFKSNLDLCR
jgi:hypothetical protein